MNEALDASKVKIDELLVAKEAIEQKLKENSSQHKLRLNEMSDQNTKDIIDLKKKLLEKDSSLAKQSSDMKYQQKAVNENVSNIPKKANESINKHEHLMTENSEEELDKEKNKKTPKRKLVRTPVKLQNPAKKSNKPFKPMTDHNKSGEMHYEVERILKHKTANNEIMFLICWKDYEEKYDLWLPESQLSCPDILKKYKKNHKII